MVSGLCRNCTHMDLLSIDDEEYPVLMFCTATRNCGDGSRSLCYVARQGGDCGPEGRLFEDGTRLDAA